MVKVLRAGLRPRCHPVHLIVETVQKETKEFLSILLTEPNQSEWVSSIHLTLLVLPATSGRTCMPGPSLLVANEAWCVSLDLGLELRWAHHVIGG